MTNQKKAFITAIKNNKEGASLDPKTLDPVLPPQGYFVSITDNEYKKPDHRTIDKLKKQAKKLNLSNWYIGYWQDPDTGKHYIDISLFIKDKKTALTIGKMHNQKAIFDCKNLDCISV